MLVYLAKNRAHRITVWNNSDTFLERIIFRFDVRAMLPPHRPASGLMTSGYQRQGSPPSLHGSAIGKLTMTSNEQWPSCCCCLLLFFLSRRGHKDTPLCLGYEWRTIFPRNCYGEWKKKCYNGAVTNRLWNFICDWYNHEISNKLLYINIWSSEASYRIRIDLFYRVLHLYLGVCVSNIYLSIFNV